jgi:NAD-dependent DNA ligase
VALKEFDSVTHEVPMLSLNNAFEDSELIAFDRRCREGLHAEHVAYAGELKFDGLAIPCVMRMALWCVLLPAETVRAVKMSLLISKRFVQFR